MRKQHYFLLSLAFALISCKTSSQTTTQSKTAKIKVLIVDGQNNHEQWPKITLMLKYYLEETGLFSVNVERSAYTWKGEEFLSEYPIAGMKNTEVLEEPKTDPNFHPAFSKYDLIISNFG